MSGEVIKSFLVSLGFGVDDASLSKFNKSIQQASTRVLALAGAVKLAAAGIFYSISKISEGFEQTGYELKILSPAINKALILRQELFKAYAATGLSLGKAVRQAAAFNLSLTKTQYILKATYASVAAKFFPLLTRQMDNFRKNIYANMPKIQGALEKFIKFIFKAFEATTILGARVYSILTRVYDFFEKLHKSTDGWSTIILGAVAAWRLLNLSFLATPLGMIISGLTALLLLWDDFKTFKEGGKSLIDWGSDTTKTILGVVTAVGTLAAAIAGIMVSLKAWAIAQAAVNAIMLLNPIGLWITGITALIALISALAIKFGYLKGALGFFSNLGESVMEFATGEKAKNFMQNTPSILDKTNPNSSLGQRPLIGNLGAGITNQNVDLQTNINITGSADAQSTGKNVTDNIGRTYFDLFKNLKEPTAR